MFSLWTRLSHRLRLTLVFGSTTAVLLGVVCLCAILFVREQSLARRFGELESGLARLLKEPGSVDQLSEVREDLPGSEVAIFEASGRPVSSTAKRAIPLTLGRYKDKDVIRVGVRAGDRTIVIDRSFNGKFAVAQHCQPLHPGFQSADEFGIFGKKTFQQAHGPQG